MADQITARLQGLKPVTDKMLGLAPKLRRKGLRKAARQAMNIVRDDAKSRAKAIDDPETAEKIWKNIVTQESGKQGRREGGVVMKVGIRGGAGANQHSKDASGNPGGDTRHWRYIEFGTQYTPPAPFMRPSFSQNLGAVTDRFVSVFSLEIDAASREV
ncbi:MULTISPECIES: HK97-gp10 family putative phage morphogenesis protein [Pseudomonas chlororaphis group]|uniref:HK97-gp10 family putative phage morphogenesis protein n=1 Tax=Pseudomonas chlororaphis group TaxID=136842 RepID=UPI0020985D33|nr:MULTISPECIES: HK97-gp10 family putative phage morphogenesis protein [Pseudomonas chlororaphis group]MCO7575348.1 HK97 gp10 family phage protein [Pseudomonas protegens]MCO7582549.1 HK97 gp10 family phage protein [Pseudomonas chlororaphis]MCO7599272.1 HK97 gp10 family phage protein [Pseudomonas chlororaphis]